MKYQPCAGAFYERASIAERVPTPCLSAAYINNAGTRRDNRGISYYEPAWGKGKREVRFNCKQSRPSLQLLSDISVKPRKKKQVTKGRRKGQVTKTEEFKADKLKKRRW